MGYWSVYSCTISDEVGVNIPQYDFYVADRVVWVERGWKYDGRLFGKQVNAAMEE